MFCIAMLSVVSSETLGLNYEEVVEQESFCWPGKTSQFPVGPAWIPWASQEVQRPVQDMPSSYLWQSLIYKIQEMMIVTRKINLCNMFLKIGHFQKGRTSYIMKSKISCNIE